MKIKLKIDLLIFALFALTLIGCSRHIEVAVTSDPVDPVFEADAGEKEVARALSTIRSAPDSPVGYNQLASAYIRLGRETGRLDYSGKAMSAIDNAIGLESSNIPARKLKATLLLNVHRFSDGLKLSEELRADLPNDPFIYGLLTDAHDELGDYDDAVVSAQKMVDLKPNASSYSRVGHIRSLHGDTKGAVDAFKLAAKMTDPADREGQSWCLVQIGNEYWANGKYDKALSAFDQALKNFPAYYLALAGKGRTLASQGKLDEAVPCLAEAQSKHLNLDTIILLGDVYSKMGDDEKARAQYDLAQGGDAVLGAANDAHRVALFWANRNENLDEALRVAELDYARQKDIYASDTLAWCLFRAGRTNEAKHLVTEAMRIGTADAKILYHAGMIEAADGDRSRARRLLGRALELNPAFDLFQADEARSALAELQRS